MDILAHALWAGAGAAALTRYRPATLRATAGAMVMAAVPDLIHLLPVLAWGALGNAPAGTLWSYINAPPTQTQILSSTVNFYAHHLHCIAHSALVASGVTLLLWRWMRWAWLPLLGWWSHIVIDVFTHSVDFYPSPVLYPITQRGFDGIAWNTPWFMWLNYSVLAAVGAWLLATRQRRVG